MGRFSWYSESDRESRPEDYATPDLEQSSGEEDEGGRNLVVPQSSTERFGEEFGFKGLEF